MNTAEKWDFITNHPQMCNNYGSSPVIEMIPVMVDPLLQCINFEEEKNSKLRWWIEISVCNPNFDIDVDPIHYERFHDYRLDCGGDSAEEAIDNLYKLVLDFYGDYDYD